MRTWCKLNFVIAGSQFSVKVGACCKSNISVYNF